MHNNTISASRVHNIIRQIIRFHNARARIPETRVSGLPVDGPSVWSAADGGLAILYRNTFARVYQYYATYIYISFYNSASTEDSAFCICSVSSVLFEHIFRRLSA